MHAVIEGEAETAALLVSQGADTTLEDNHGKTAVDYAREAGYKDLNEMIDA